MDKPTPTDRLPGVHLFVSIQNSLFKVFSGISRISQAMLFILGLIIFYDVFMRYIFNRPTFWVLEISEYLLVFMGFAGIAEVQASKRHIAVGFFHDLLPAAIQHWLDTLFHLLLVSFCLLLFWQSLKMTIIAYTYGSQATSLLGTPMFIPYAIIPVTMLLLLTQGLVDIVEDIRRIITQKDKEE